MDLYTILKLSKGKRVMINQLGNYQLCKKIELRHFENNKIGCPAPISYMKISFKRSKSLRKKNEQNCFNLDIRRDFSKKKKLETYWEKMTYLDAHTLLFPEIQQKQRFLKTVKFPNSQETEHIHI